MDSGNAGDKYLHNRVTASIPTLYPMDTTFVAFNFQTPHKLLTWLDVFSDDGDMLVSVWTGVFMPEPNHMAQLMSHNAKLVTVFPNGYGLWASSSAPNIGTTAGQLQKYPG